MQRSCRLGSNGLADEIALTKLHYIIFQTVRSAFITILTQRNDDDSEDIEPRIKRRRLALFGHVARMPAGVPAHDVLQSALGIRCGSIPDPAWKRPRGRPRLSWAEQLRGDLGGLGLWEAWDLAMDREVWRGFATSRCSSSA